MALPEQRLLCRLDWDGQRVTGVHLRSARLLEATRLFEGHSPGEVLALLPRLYTLCGQAHAAAARLALDPQADVPAADLRRVRAENLREHLLYLFVHWPEACGQDTAARELPPALSLVSRLLAAPDDNDARRRLHDWLEHHLFAMPADSFLALDATGLLAWAQRGATLPARQLRETLSLPLPPMPDLAVLEQQDLNAVAQTLDSRQASTFVACPALADGCRWTGPGTHQTREALRDLPAPGRHLATRLRALAQDWNTADDDRQPLFRAAGLACAETSRGLLVHRARLRDGRVSDYRILAPTEWNFHPRGLAARWLMRLEARTSSELHRLASRLVRAIDPCVNFTIRIDTAEHLAEAAHA